MKQVTELMKDSTLQLSRIRNSIAKETDPDVKTDLWEIYHEQKDKINKLLSGEDYVQTIDIDNSIVFDSWSTIINLTWIKIDVYASTDSGFPIIMLKVKSWGEGKSSAFVYAQPKELKLILKNVSDLEVISFNDANDFENVLSAINSLKFSQLGDYFWKEEVPLGFTEKERLESINKQKELDKKQKALDKKEINKIKAKLIREWRFM